MNQTKNWQAIRKATQQKREITRKSSIGQLTKAGITFSDPSKKGYILCIDINNFRIRFWPSTGLWKVLDSPIQSRGVFPLIAFIKDIQNA